MLGISPENIRNQSFIKSSHSFVSRKSTKKLTSEGDCLRYKSWSAGQFHFQKLLSTKKKIDEASPLSHLNVLRMTSTAPLYSAIVYSFYKTNNKKKHCDTGNELWWITLLKTVQKDKGAFQNWQFFLLFSIFKKITCMNFFLALAPDLAVLRWIRMHFKDFKIFGQSRFLESNRKQRCLLKVFSLYYLFKQKYSQAKLI